MGIPALNSSKGVSQHRRQQELFDEEECDDAEDKPVVDVEKQQLVDDKGRDWNQHNARHRV